MKKKHDRREITFHLILGGLTAAFYVILTIFSAFFNLAYGGLQFRLSEALCILPAFFPSAVAGLTIGCIISNFFSPMMVLDVVFGSLATLAAALLGRALRDIKFKGVPWLLPMPAVIINAIAVGLEITLFMEGSAGFLITAVQVAIGQIICCYGLGIPLYICLEKLGLGRLVQKHSKWGGNIK